MAFNRVANVQDFSLVQSANTWNGVRTASTEPLVSPNLVEQASDILKAKFTPDNYLLTHATIVASVDTYNVSGAKIGSFKEGSKNFQRKYANYRVRPKCDRWINNNGDAWDRPVLLKSYRTFVGSHNFVEHVQREEESKGRIIDAVARDIGDSVYIDILIATDRKHRELIAAIESGKMNSMSMGCVIDHSTCTKCGNVAVDETEMCDHVRYQKGTYFWDDLGQRHRVAELCGHHSDGETGGVKFIEASWVRVPAFPGAVLRTVLQPEEITIDNLRAAKSLLSRAPQTWSGEELDGYIKAASLVNAYRQVNGQFDFGGDEEEDAEDTSDKGLLEETMGKAKKEIVKRLRQQIVDEISPKPEIPPMSTSENTEMDSNLLKNSFDIARLYQGAVSALVRVASSDADLLSGISQVNNSFGVSVPKELYRVALLLGPTYKYKSSGVYLERCAKVMGRTPCVSEQKTLVRLSNLLARRSG